MSYRFCRFLLLFFLGPAVVQAVVINELMVDPGQCSDTLCEWLELSQSPVQALDLSTCFLNGNRLPQHFFNTSYMVIARNLARFEEYFGNNDTVWNETDGFPALQGSFQLPNTGGVVELTGNCSDRVDYTPFVALANGNNKTLERREDNSWGESLSSGGTPGRENSIFRLSTDYEDIIISEFLPDPFGNDTTVLPQGEWIELYNTGMKAIDLKGLRMTDDTSEHELFISNTNTVNGTIIQPQGYLVVYQNEDSDFSLNNNGYDEVHLWEGQNHIDQVSFSGSTEGMSWSWVNNQWVRTPPTPDAANRYTPGCDWTMALDVNNTLSTGRLPFDVRVHRHYGLPANITVRGRIETSFGETKETYRPWTNESATTTLRKSYSPHLENGVYQVFFEISDLSCEEHPEDNTIQQVVAINPQYQQNQSFLAIERVTPSPASWGESITATIKIYKGDDTKSSIETFVQSDNSVTVSKRSRFSVQDRFRNYTLAIPIPLALNCEGQFSDGKYQLVVEGLGLQVQSPLTIAGLGEKCPSAPAAASSSSSSSKNRYELVALPTEVEEGISFPVTVQIVNDGKEHSFTLWSYVYRGSKSYSGEREANQETITIQPSQTKQIDLLIPLDEAIEPGTYKVKVHIQKDQQKTTTELTRSILVTGKKELPRTETEVFLASGEKGTLSSPSSAPPHTEVNQFPTSIVVYQSNSRKAFSVVSYLLIGLLLLTIAIVWRGHRKP